jgi:hypothetical protein
MESDGQPLWNGVDPLSSDPPRRTRSRRLELPWKKARRTMKRKKRTRMLPGARYHSSS